MFTGIVQAVGKVVSAQPRADGVRLVVDTGALPVDDVALGDSIAVNGCCLTVVERIAGRGAAGDGDGAHLAFDVSAETLRCTTGLDGSRPVNLEKALRLADRLGGHLVSGHVDGVGRVVAFAPVEAKASSAAKGDAIVSASDAKDCAEGAGAPIQAACAAKTAGDDADGSWHLVVEVPADLARYVAAKGSIAVQGVSLTVNRIEGARFEVNLIPHTLAATTLHALHRGAEVNLEVDLVARYLERLVLTTR